MSGALQNIADRVDDESDRRLARSSQTLCRWEEWRPRLNVLCRTGDQPPPLQGARPKGRNYPLWLRRIPTPTIPRSDWVVADAPRPASGSLTRRLKRAGSAPSRRVHSDRARAPSESLNKPNMLRRSLGQTPGAKCTVSKELLMVCRNTLACLFCTAAIAVAGLALTAPSALGF